MKKQNKNTKRLLFEMMEKINPDFKERKLCESDVTRYVDFGETEEDFLTVNFFGDCKMIDDGIGSYEFWGSKGYDSRMVAKCENISWDKYYYSDEENIAIKKYLDENYEDIQLEIEEKHNEKYEKEGDGEGDGGRLDDFDYKYDR